MRRPRNRSASTSAAAKFREDQHKRGPGGKFADKPGAGDDAPKTARRLVGEERLKTSGVTADDEIVQISTRLRSYKNARTVQDFVSTHPKGRAYALRKLAADHKKGVIGFRGLPPAPTAPVTPVVPAAKVAPIKPADPPAAVSTRARIEEAYFKITKGEAAQAVRLSALRTKLSDMDRKTVDAGLLRIAGGDKDGDGSARLSQFTDPKALDANERAAAFSPAGEPFHILWLEDRKR